MQNDPPAGPPPTGPPGPEGDPLVGTVLADRYRIVRKLGEGGMGAVYLGEHLRFGRLDAIKVLRDTMARDREATERFLRGARNASAIQHQNVCTVYDFSDVDGVQFLAMEYVEGDTLADVLERDGPLPLARALELMRQVAAGLAAAHERGIVHRDLKPGNVMLAKTRDGGERVKVVDFDIAKGSAEGEARDVTRAGFVVGTPEYMSPEQLTGDPLDGRSDLYSLGIVLFRTLTGSIPSRAADTQDLMVERLTADPLRLAEVAPERTFPAAVQELLDRLLQRRREDRFGSAQEVAAAIEAVAGGGRPDPGTRLATAREAEALGPPRGGGAASPAGSRRLVLGIAGGAVLVAVAVFLLLRPPGTTPASPDAGAGPQALDAATGGVDPDGANGSTSTAATEAEIGGGTTGGGDPADPGRPGAEDPTERDVGADGRATATDDVPGRPDPGADASPMTALEAEAVLFRQLELLDAAAAPPAALRAGEDTARIVWEQPGLGANERGLAAYVMASLLQARGDDGGAVRWLERALEARPGYEPYRAMLARLRGGG